MTDQDASTVIEAETPEAPAPLTDEGNLSEEGQRRLRAFLAEHWQNWNCPFHGATRWDANPTLGQWPGYRGQGFANYTFPTIVMTCSICGFMVPINAIKAGIVPADTPEVSAPDGEGSASPEDK